MSKQRCRSTSTCYVSTRYVSTRLFVERGYTRKHFALKKLERRSAACADVRHLVRQARLLDGGHGVPAADDGDAALGSQAGQALGCGPNRNDRVRGDEMG